MKKVLLFCFSFYLCVLAHSQKVHFVYFQSEGGAPFYVKMNDKVYSSSAEGYLILPKLIDSTYSFLLGQSGKSKEVQFNITINKNDKGYLIKTVDNTPVLFDLQTLSLTRPVVLSQPSSGTIAKTDHFTKLLAKAADDSTLLYQVVFTEPAKQEPKQEVAAEKTQPEEKKESDVAVTPPAENNVVPTASINKADTPAVVASIKEPSVDTVQANVITSKPADQEIAKNEDTKKAEEEKPVASEPISNETEFKKSVVKKRSESSTSEGFGLVFLDNYEGGTDTIRIVIPNPKVVFKDSANEAVAEKKSFLDIPSQPVDSPAVEKKDSVEVQAALNPRKAVCNSVSTDDDFFKLRRNMAAEKNDEGMLAQASRYFKSKCFKTEQIKYLSALFLTEPSKYQFFDLAFMHVTDQERYEVLQSELKDPYYINRFKALIAK